MMKSYIEKYVQKLLKEIVRMAIRNVCYVVVIDQRMYII